MKSSTSLLSGILILAIGVILIICRTQITGAGIVTTAGLLFLITGIINLVLYVTQKDETGKRRTRGLSALLGWLVSSATIILGLCMLVFNSTFKSLIPFLFGLLVVFGALMLLYAIVFGLRRVMVIPGWTYIFPLAMGGLAAGIFSSSEDKTIMLLTGIGFLVFGIAGVVYGTLMASGNATMKRNGGVRVGSATNTRAVSTQVNSAPKELKSLDD